PLDLYTHALGGPDTDRLLLQTEASKSVSSWSPDGRFLAYSSTASNRQQDIWIIPVNGGRPFAYLHSNFNELQPGCSPDGLCIAYTGDTSGRMEVYVSAFEGAPARGPAIQISTEGGSHPQWRKDGKELFYLSPDHHLWSAPVARSMEFRAHPPRKLFQTRIA